MFSEYTCKPGQSAKLVCCGVQLLSSQMLHNLGELAPGPMVPPSLRHPWNAALAALNPVLGQARRPNLMAIRQPGLSWHESS